MGEHISALRINLGLSQLELARLCGVCQQYISFIENNKKLPSLTVAKRLAKALGVTLDELISDS